MNIRRRRGRDGTDRRQAMLLLAAAVILSAVGAIASGALAAGTLPVSPTSLGANHAYDGLQVKPLTIIYTGDGTGFLGGPSVSNRSSGIDWTKWTANIAVGSGFNQLNDCNPSCAGGKFHGYPVKIELWRPRTLAGTLVFTRMTIFYEKSRPREEPRHYTFTDTFTKGVDGVSGGYDWGPPGAVGYCIHTHGLGPAAGCQNIHSLP